MKMAWWSLEQRAFPEGETGKRTLGTAVVHRMTKRTIWEGDKMYLIAGQGQQVVK